MTRTFKRASLVLECSHLCIPALIVVSASEKSPDIAGGVHVGKDDLGVGAGDQGIMLRYAIDGTGKTEMRILMVGLEAAGKTTIFRW